MRRLAAALAALALVAGCGEPARERRDAAERHLASTDPNRAMAYLVDGRVSVRSPARGAGRDLDRLPAPATALAWAADGQSLYATSGLAIFRLPVGGGAPAHVATIHDEANEAVVRLDLGADGRTLVAMTAALSGEERLANRRYWVVDPTTGVVRETSGRDADARAARRPRATSSLTAPIGSPSGRWELRVAPAGAGTAERLEIAAAGGAARALVELGGLPANDARYTGTIDDAGWAAGSDTVLFVAETLCGETCSGPLFAVDADGSNLRRLAESVEEVPREWNGDEALVDDFPTERQVVLLVDVATGDRVELGPGASPKWAPK